MSLPQLLKIPSVQAFLMSGDIFDVFEGICTKHGLPIERSEEFLDLCDAVINGDLAFEHMPDLIMQAFGITEDKAKQITVDVAGHRLLPLANFLPGIEEGIVALGGNPADFTAAKIVKGQEVERLALSEIATSLQIPLTDVVLKRMVFLLQQFAKGEKTEAALKTYFSRSLNIGGLGLNEEQATALLAATLPHAASLLEIERPAPVPVATKIEASKPKVKPLAKPAVVSAPKQELEIAPSHELAAEVPMTASPDPIVVKQKTQTPPAPKPVVRAPAGVPVATKVQPLAPKPKTDADIDPNELKAPAKKAAVARKLTEGVQDSFATALALATENAAPILRKHKISEKVFADLAGKAIRGVRDIYQTRDIVERDWELRGQELATLMQAIALGIDTYQSAPRPSTQTKPDAQRTTSAASAGEASDLDARFSKLTEGEVDMTVQPVRAQLTVGSTSLKTPDGQRKMVDVIGSSRLAGPIEQLGKMTPTEFRRLSSNASEAGQKLEDLLSALESTSYEERVKGVLAWRDSPMNQLYLQITQEALSQGLALPEVSSRRRAAGKESLSPAEIKALALLNTKIRF